MQINKIVSSAKVITITDLTKGNVIKFIDSQYSEEKLKYAIVTDVLRDAENTYVSLLTFDLGYGSVEIKSKLLSGGKNFAIFPATPEEVSTQFTKIEEKLCATIQQKKNEVATLEAEYQSAKLFMDNQLENDLTEPSFQLN